MSTFADTKWLLSGKTLYVSWITDIGNHGLAVLSQGSPNAPSTLVPLPIGSWSAFKEYTSTLEMHRYIFRGHSNRAARVTATRMVTAT